MIVICAWCEKEGTLSLLKVWPPVDDGRLSHGICKAHAVSYLAAIPSQRLSSMTQADNADGLKKGRLEHRNRHL
jgi:hypothetical protein